MNVFDMSGRRAVVVVGPRPLPGLAGDRLRDLRSSLWTVASRPGSGRALTRSSHFRECLTCLGPPAIMFASWIRSSASRARHLRADGHIGGAGPYVRRPPEHRLAVVLQGGVSPSQESPSGRRAGGPCCV